MADGFVDDQATRATALFETVERIRVERFSHLDAELVRRVLQLHADPAASESDLARGLDQIIERHLSGGA